MKKNSNFLKALLCSAAIIAMQGTVNAQQWTGNNNTTDAIYRNGRVGLGVNPETNLHLDLKASAAAKFDGLRIHYDRLNGATRGEIGFENGPGSGNGFVIHAWAGGAGFGWADINFKTNGTTKMYIESNGNVGIGTVSTGNAKLTVNGNIIAEEIQVKDVAADFVFDENYKLRSLEETEAFIKENKHLPEVPPASVTEKGVNLGEFNQLLLQKVEELTLHLIEINKENQNLKKEILEIKASK